MPPFPALTAPDPRNNQTAVDTLLQHDHYCARRSGHSVQWRARRYAAAAADVAADDRSGLVGRRIREGSSVRGRAVGLMEWLLGGGGSYEKSGGSTSRDGRDSTYDDQHQQGEAQLPGLSTTDGRRAGGMEGSLQVSSRIHSHRSTVGYTMERHELTNALSQLCLALP